MGFSINDIKSQMSTTVSSPIKRELIAQASNEATTNVYANAVTKGTVDAGLVAGVTILTGNPLMAVGTVWALGAYRAVTNRASYIAGKQSK